MSSETPGPAVALVEQGSFLNKPSRHMVGFSGKNTHPFTTEPDGFCPLCKAKGQLQTVKTYRINFTQSIFLCSNAQCIYPLGSTPLDNIIANTADLKNRKPAIQQKRNISELSPPSLPNGKRSKHDPAISGQFSHTNSSTTILCDQSRSVPIISKRECEVTLPKTSPCGQTENGDFSKQNVLETEVLDVLHNRSAHPSALPGSCRMPGQDRLQVEIPKKQVQNTDRLNYGSQSIVNGSPHASSDINGLKESSGKKHETSRSYPVMESPVSSPKSKKRRTENVLEGHELSHSSKLEISATRGDGSLNMMPIPHNSEENALSDPIYDEQQPEEPCHFIKNCMQMLSESLESEHKSESEHGIGAKEVQNIRPAVPTSATELSTASFSTHNETVQSLNDKTVFCRVRLASPLGPSLLKAHDASEMESTLCSVNGTSPPSLSINPPFMALSRSPCSNLPALPSKVCHLSSNVQLEDKTSLLSSVIGDKPEPVINDDLSVTHQDEGHEGQEESSTQDDHLTDMGNLLKGSSQTTTLPASTDIILPESQSLLRLSTIMAEEKTTLPTSTEIVLPEGQSLLRFSPNKKTTLPTSTEIVLPDNQSLLRLSPNKIEEKTTLPTSTEIVLPDNQSLLRLSTIMAEEKTTLPTSTEIFLPESQSLLRLSANVAEEKTTLLPTTQSILSESLSLSLSANGENKVEEKTTLPTSTEVILPESQSLLRSANGLEEKTTLPTSPEVIVPESQSLLTLSANDAEEKTTLLPTTQSILLESLSLSLSANGENEVERKTTVGTSNQNILPKRSSPLTNGANEAEEKTTLLPTTQSILSESLSLSLSANVADEEKTTLPTSTEIILPESQSLLRLSANVENEAQEKTTIPTSTELILPESQTLLRLLPNKIEEKTTLPTSTEVIVPESQSLLRLSANDAEEKTTLLPTTQSILSDSPSLSLSANVADEEKTTLPTSTEIVLPENQSLLRSANGPEEKTTLPTSTEVTVPESLSLLRSANGPEENTILPTSTEVILPENQSLLTLSANDTEEKTTLLPTTQSILSESPSLLLSANMTDEEKTTHPTSNQNVLPKKPSLLTSANGANEAKEKTTLPDSTPDILSKRQSLLTLSANAAEEKPMLPTTQSIMPQKMTNEPEEKTTMLPTTQNLERTLLPMSANVANEAEENTALPDSSWDFLESLSLLSNFGNDTKEATTLPASTSPESPTLPTSLGNVSDTKETTVLPASNGDLSSRSQPPLLLPSNVANADELITRKPGQIDSADTSGAKDLPDQLDLVFGCDKNESIMSSDSLDVTKTVDNSSLMEDLSISSESDTEPETEPSKLPETQKSIQEPVKNFPSQIEATASAFKMAPLVDNYPNPSSVMETNLGSYKSPLSPLPPDQEGFEKEPVNLSKGSHFKDSESEKPAASPLSESDLAEPKKLHFENSILPDLLLDIQPEHRMEELLSPSPIPTFKVLTVRPDQDTINVLQDGMVKQQEERSKVEINDPEFSNHELQTSMGLSGSRTSEGSLNESFKSGPVDASMEQYLSVNINERKTFENSQGRLQWRNKLSMCWLDCILSTLVQSRTVSFFVSEYGNNKSSIICNLFAKYAEATAMGSKLNSKKGKAGKPTKSEVCLHDVRMHIFNQLQPLLKCDLGQKESPVFAFPLLLKLDPDFQNLFMHSFTWNFKCTSCGYTYQERCQKTLTTFTKIGKDWGPLNAVHRSPCNKCQSEDQTRQMTIETLQSVFILHFVEGLPSNKLKEYSFQFDGHLYEIRAIIKYRDDHFSTWTANDDDSWLESDGLKGSICWRHHKFRVRAENIHIAIWERSNAKVVGKESAHVEDVLQTSKGTSEAQLSEDTDAMDHTEAAQESNVVAPFVDLVPLSPVKKSITLSPVKHPIQADPTSHLDSVAENAPQISPEAIGTATTPATDDAANLLAGMEGYAEDDIITLTLVEIPFESTSCPAENNPELELPDLGLSQETADTDVGLQDDVQPPNPSEVLQNTDPGHASAKGCPSVCSLRKPPRSRQEDPQPSLTGIDPIQLQNSDSAGQTVKAHPKQSPDVQSMQKPKPATNRVVRTSSVTARSNIPASDPKSSIASHSPTKTMGNSVPVAVATSTPIHQPFTTKRSLVGDIMSTLVKKDNSFLNGGLSNTSRKNFTSKQWQSFHLSKETDSTGVVKKAENFDGFRARTLNKSSPGSNLLFSKLDSRSSVFNAPKEKAVFTAPKERPSVKSLLMPAASGPGKNGSIYGKMPKDGSTQNEDKVRKLRLKLLKKLKAKKNELAMLEKMDKFKKNGSFSGNTPGAGQVGVNRQEHLRGFLQELQDHIDNADNESVSTMSSCTSICSSPGDAEFFAELFSPPPASNPENDGQFLEMLADGFQFSGYSQQANGLDHGMNGNTVEPSGVNSCLNQSTAAEESLNIMSSSTLAALNDDTDYLASFDDIF